MPLKWTKKLVLSNKKILRQGLKFFLYLNNFSYRQAGIWAMKYYGIHPKHLFNTYHSFFLDNINPDDSVLDFGCGKGELTLDIAKKAKRVAAYDMNEETIEYAKRFNSQDNIHYFLGDATKDMPDEKFDVIVSSNVLEHLKDPVEHLKKLKIIANKLLLRIPNIDRGWLVEVKKDLGVNYFLDPQHYREYTELSIADELNKAGWKITSIEHAGDELRIVAHNINKNNSNGR